MDSSLLLNIYDGQICMSGQLVGQFQQQAY